LTAADILGLVRGLTPLDQASCGALADAWLDSGDERESGRLRREAEKLKREDEERERKKRQPTSVSLEERIEALAIHLEDPSDEFFERCSGGDRDEEVSVDGQDYLVCTEDEIEQLWDDALDSYIDDGAVEIPDYLEAYFDREAWKKDARHDGAGHALASYDHKEHEVEVEGVHYHIFRTG
jgi:hypothetical protein